MREIVAVAVPTLAFLIGFIWYFRRKKPANASRTTDPPDKKDANVNSEIAKEKTEVSNGSAGSVTGCSEFSPASEKSSANVVGKRLDEKETKVVSGKGDASETKPQHNPVVNEEVAEEVVQKSYSELSYSNILRQEKPDTSYEQTVPNTEEKLGIVPNTNTTTTTSLDSEPVTADNAVNDNNSSHMSHEDLSSKQTQASDNNCELQESGSDLNEVNNTNSVLEDQIIQETTTELSQPQSMTRSWCEDIPEDTINPDLTDTLSYDTYNNTAPKRTEYVNSNGNNNGTSRASLENGDQSHESPSGSKDKSANDKNDKSPKQEEKNSDTNHSDSSSNCDNLSEASNDSGKGGSVHENLTHTPPEEDRIFEFNIPSDMCGLFIGRNGKTIKFISQQSGTKIRLQNNPYTPKYQICVVEGTQSSIECACSIIKRKFPDIRFPGPDLTHGGNTMIMPEIMQLSLPEGVSVDVVVSSIVDAGRIFVQQPTHPSYTSLDRLNTFMNQCYMREGAIPDIPRPIEAGVICAAPMLNGWYRAQIMATYEDKDECDIKYVDYGGYSRVSNSLLKQIRSDFMTLPFQAVECYLANLTPLEHEQFFSPEAAVVLEELTQGKMLQARAVGQAEDGIPFVEIFQIFPGALGQLVVNHEMVQRNVVRWVEQSE